jgi:hypothetical protein
MLFVAGKMFCSACHFIHDKTGGGGKVEGYQKGGKSGIFKVMAVYGHFNT